MNIKATLNALNSASDKVKALQAKLSEKARDELADLIEIDGDYELDVYVRYGLYDKEFAIELFYTKQASTRKSLDLMISCDWANLIICTTTRNAQIIKKLIEFCETHILGGFDDKFVEY